jgi:hypothetical protein
MKNRQHVLPCGRVVYYKETTPKDIGTSKKMVKLLNENRKELEKIYAYNNAGRHRTRWAGYVYNKFCKILATHLSDCLINGDRVETSKGHKWMIAGDTKPNNRHANWHSDGKKYSVVISGIKGNFGVRLSRKKRKELQARIMSGQNYHISNE